MKWQYFGPLIISCILIPLSGIPPIGLLAIPIYLLFGNHFDGVAFVIYPKDVFGVIILFIYYYFLLALLWPKKIEIGNNEVLSQYGIEALDQASQTKKREYVRRVIFISLVIFIILSVGLVLGALLGGFS